MRNKGLREAPKRNVEAFLATTPPAGTMDFGLAPATSRYTAFRKTRHVESIMRELVLLLAIFLALLAVTLWSPFSIAENDADVTGDFGEPIPGLDVVDRFSFDRGRRDLRRRP